MSDTISIFILKSQVNSLTQAETFLRNRKWIVASSTNLRDALAYIIQKQPKYVMISADHPNKKVRVLPKMLVQAFPVRVIGFAEKGTGVSAKNLNEMALEYNLYPPVSGPAIERMVLKIRKDEELRAQQEELAAKNPRPDGSQAPQDTITFKGESFSAGDMKTSFEQARAALTQMINSDSGDDTPAIVSGSKDRDGAIFTPGSDSGTEGSGFFGSGSQGAGSQGGSGNFNPGTGPQGSGTAFMMNQPGQNSQFAGNVATNFNPSLSGNVATTQNPQLAGNVATNFDPQLTGNVAQGFNPLTGSGGFHPTQTQGPGPGSNFFNNPEEAGNFQDGFSNWNSKTPGSGSSDENSQDPSEPESTGRRRGPHVPVMESDYVPKTPQKEYRMTRAEERLGRRNDSIIVRGTEIALEESVNLKNRENPKAVEKSSNIACITVQSPKFSGYLVCAMGKNRKIDKTFFQAIQTRLFNFLKANGEQIKEEDAMSLRIEEVDFTDWALEQAEFLKKSVHDGDEIAMAFFPSTDLDIQLEDSATDKMVKMNIQDLKENVALEFDLYIFMPENNKYLLYTPKGKPFYGNQKGRLNEKGITHMHLRRDSAHNVKKYKAQNFLNDKISAYKSTLKREA